MLGVITGVIISAMLAAAALPALAMPAGNNQRVAQEVHDKTSIAYAFWTSFEDVTFEVEIDYTSLPVVNFCTTANSTVENFPKFCQNYYARHSNGRCYRVVDKPQDGGAVAKHEYRVNRGEGQKDCLVIFPQTNAKDLKPGEMLDLCDEDGGCDNYVSDNDMQIISGAGGVSETGCSRGYVLDENNKCRPKTAVGKPRQPSKEDCTLSLLHSWEK